MTLSDEYRAELRKLATEIAVAEIDNILNNRMRIMEELPYVHLTREEEDTVADYLEECLRHVRNTLLVFSAREPS